MEVSGPTGAPGYLALQPLLAGDARRTQVSDLHCVTTWSAVGLRWGGVPYKVVHDAVVDLHPSVADAGWVSFIGVDGYSACMLVQDALADDVMIVEELAGEALTNENGGPIRLIAPQHYGYKSVKHVVAITYRTSYSPGSAGPLAHPRGRVALEERSSEVLPGWVWRRVWRAGKPAVRAWYRLRRSRITVAPSTPSPELEN